MRKKNTLYTANKWNQPLFARGVDRVNNNIFDGENGSILKVPSQPPPLTDIQGYKEPDLKAEILADNQAKAASWKPSLGKKVGNMFGAGTTGGSILGAVSGMVGQGLNSAISGGLSSGAGSAISSIGSTLGGAVGAVNPLFGAAITVGSGLVGGLTNAAFGSKLNEENIAAVNNTVSDMRNAAHAMGKSRTSTDILNQWGSIDMGSDFDNSYIGKDGWFSSKAKKEAERLRNKQNIARMVASHALATTADNVDAATDDIAAQNVKYAFGGFLGDTSDMGAIDYGFMSDYLSMKDKQADKSKIAGMTQMPAFMNGFALGGDLQTHGGDFSTGLTIIGAGGSHEENPYQGVQLGTDQEGTPNLVEEGEIIFNDYVYSKRILADDDTKKQFRLPRKKDISYADIAKRLTKESTERPNDPISQAALQMQMNKLAEQQERQKAEMQEAQAQEAFASLSPEEKQALLMEAAARRQQGAEEQQMAEQAMQEQAMAEQGMQEPSPEELAMAQQQMMADGSEASLEPEPEGYAYGGKVNKFDKGGKKNAGTWKSGKSSEHWNTYTRRGLIDYLKGIIGRINDASSEAEKDKIRQEAIKTVGDIQQAYAKAYRSNLTPSEQSEDVKTLQTLFQKAGGNAHFGNISDAINLPAGHNTTDTEKGGYVDSFWGPRTSIRNWGSTEYGDGKYYKDIADLATEAGLVYAPNAEWKYGNNTLYGLSLPGTSGTAPATSPRVFHAMVDDEDYIQGELDPNLVGDEVRRETLPNGDTVIYHAHKGAADTTGDAEGNKGKIDLSQYEPVLKKEWPRYAGLFGPAVGLGMQALGIGKPNTAGLDAAVNLVGRSGARASYQPIPDYLRVQPMDMWSAQNKMDANSRATDRSILNSGNVQGSRMAGLLANNYNSMLASGDLYKKGLEYNDANRKMVTDFNRATNMFNADAYNKVSLANAELASGADRAKATLAMQAAQAKMNADAAWNQGIYGNVSGLFKGIGELGRENAQHNMLARMAASGLFGYAEPENAVFSGLIKRKNSAKKGGKITKRKRKGGLTI